LLAYMYPFVLLLVATFAAYYAFGKNEIVAAAAGLGILVPYYFVLYTMRARLTKKFSFTIIKN
ncbi:MAG: SoxR reducing system RseC family protein, partial [Bacteroidaceae bacterium]|nr:SoxR reducing system RseC family protein [Bacteroidaceae bacterium]